MVIITIVSARFTNSFDELKPRASISKGLLVKRYNICQWGNNGKKALWLVLP
jgi:hypothetical protein